jgi:hypothetical protein
MSECPIDQPAAPSPARLSVVPRAGVADEVGRDDDGRWDAAFLELVDRVRADARLADRHGLLGRYVEVDDPNRGVGLFEAVASQDTSGLSDSGWLDRQEAIGLLQSRLAAWQAEATAGYEASLRGVSADLGHRYPEPGDRAADSAERRWVAGDLRSPADELALVWHLHKGAATARIHTSCELTHNFPATLAALEEGDLTERAAFTIVRELSVLDDPEALRAGETAVLEWAKKHPLQKLKREVQREAARRSPESRGKAHARAMDERSVRIFTTSDGTAELIHTQDALDASAVMNSLTRAGTYRRRHGDPRTLDQLRADIALARLLPRSKTGNHAAEERAQTQPTDLVDESMAGDDAADTGQEGVCDLPDESVVGAEASVVIHATGAEIRPSSTARTAPEERPTTTARSLKSLCASTSPEPWRAISSAAAPRGPELISASPTNHLSAARIPTHPLRPSIASSACAIAPASSPVATARRSSRISTTASPSRTAAAPLPRISTASADIIIA